MSVTPAPEAVRVSDPVPSVPPTVYVATTVVLENELSVALDLFNPVHVRRDPLHVNVNVALNIPVFCTQNVYVKGPVLIHREVVVPPFGVTSTS